MKKVLLSILALFVVANLSFAALTVQQARSKEQLKNEGYSNATIQIVQQESGEYNVKPTNRWQKTGFRIWHYIDPSSPVARDDYQHDIKPFSYYSDL